MIRRLNDSYKNCVTYCRCLSERLQTFLLDKQKLMDRFNGLTAEKLIYSHTVHMVSSPYWSTCWCSLQIRLYKYTVYSACFFILGIMCVFYCFQVQSAALDEMFHYGTASTQRYQRALLLMEGLSRTVTEQKDLDSIDKCMWQPNMLQSEHLWKGLPFQLTHFLAKCYSNPICSLSLLFAGKQCIERRLSALQT